MTKLAQIIEVNFVSIRQKLTTAKAAITFLS
jgi:hypothetical protein